ncbi:hypothetical protein FSP39_013758 [Pinctada imbricata]|uniref:Opine dehydrogenase domain-containing protein n=1 Tax=Pinctada imbricata TaxID=66713 RepID=A0AA88XS60_PINIB|nr:hypothetical protein FSP39_013758 [Pinctada imbricata]
MSFKSRRNILICGGGNGAHCIAAIASSTQPEADVNVLTLFADEAERWRESSQKAPLTATRSYQDGSAYTFEAHPKIITKDPSLVVPHANIIFIVVPAFTHQQYIEAIAPHVKDSSIIVGLPARFGFEFQIQRSMGQNAERCAIASFETLPWVCRIEEFGVSIRIMGTKDMVIASILKGSRYEKDSLNIFNEIQTIFGESPKIKLLSNYLSKPLVSPDFIHPAILYAKWKDWDGEAVAEKPLFYQGVDHKAAQYLNDLSEEMISTAREIARQQSGVDTKDVVPLIDWYKNHYSDQLVDDSSLMRALQTNKAYDGLVHPMKETSDGKFVPDFAYRYLSEDVPFGMAVQKGIAELAGVKTPVMDEVLTWAQEKIGKEYIIGSKLTGKNVPETLVPQNYDIANIGDLFKH